MKVIQLFLLYALAKIWK